MAKLLRGALSSATKLVRRGGLRHSSTNLASATWHDSVPYSRGKQNTISLIGNVATTVELKESSNNSMMARFRLAVAAKARDGSKESNFYTVMVFGDTARQAAENLDNSDRVWVEGTLRINYQDENDPDSGIRNLLIFANNIGPVVQSDQDQYSTPTKAQQVDQERKPQASNSQQRRQAGGSEAFRSLWQSLLEDPDSFKDFRDSQYKRNNPRFPDFKRKSDGRGLWVDNCPDDLRPKVELQFGKGRNADEHDTQSASSPDPPF